MPQLLDCPECGSPIPLTAPGGLCPSCLLQLALETDRRQGETPLTADPDSTGRHDAEPTGNTTAEHAAHPDSTGLFQSAGASRGGGRETLPAGPRTLGNLDVFEEIGRGGMGVVYRARQRLANRDVAVKVLPGNLATHRSAVDRFSGEIAALAGLHHPNIVKVFEVGEDSGCVYFSMELVRGGTLASRARRAPLTPSDAAAIIEKLADAVQSAHAAGLLHRDIKPANVLLAADGSPKLTDFGLAKWMDREEGLTETGAVLGTPSYMAPEQAVGSKQGTLGPPTDVYGLGATLYDLLTGRAPFRGESTFETLQRVINDPPVPPRVLNPAVHPDLNAVCLKCLEKDPARRYSTAQELANDLHRWRMGDPTQARGVSLQRRVWRAMRRRAKWAAVVVMLAAAVAVGIFIATKKGPPTAEEAMAALRRGEKVTFIGESGSPGMHRWAVGLGEAGEQGAGKQFTVVAAETGLLELVPDSQTDRYRFSAEFRINASVHNDSTAGLYFAHRRSNLGGGVAVDRAVVVDFTDDRMTSIPVFHLAGPQNGEPNVFDQVTVNHVLYYVPPATGQLKFSRNPFGLLRVVDPLDSAGTKKLDQIPWRQIVATVGPDELRVQWRDPDGSYRPVGIPVHGKPSLPAIPTIQFKRQDLQDQLVLKNVYPGIDTSGLAPYSSRGGLGLYVYNARVFFRNVVVEPLPE